MKSARIAAAAALLGVVVAENPLGKVIQLMDDLSAKVTADGEAAEKAYHTYFEWCDESSHNAKFAIEDATKQKAELEAKISEFGSDIEVAVSRIEKLADALSSAEEDLKNATVIREKEASTFAASEKELMDTVDSLSRAISLLEKEMAKSPGSFAQLDASSLTGTLQALSAVLDAAAFTTNDRNKLQALLQTQESADDEEPGAPAAAVYKSKSGNIVEVLEDMKEKAETQLSELRKGETTAKHNFEMLKSSLEAQTEQDEKDMKEEKANKAEAEEGKAESKGELETVTKSLANSKEELASTQSACMQTAADHEASRAGRAEELKVIAEAKKILVETSKGAVEQTYSFVQLASASADSTESRVAALVRKLAMKHHSSALAQLASRVTAVAKFGAKNGSDPFAKIKGLIQDMIAKLEKEHQAEADEKAYCDEQMAKTEAKKSELEDDVAKMTAKIDSSAARSAKLKAEVKVLQEELAALSKEQAEMDKIRQDAHAEYVDAKKDLEMGLMGVRKALSVLRDYYGSKEEGAALLQQPAPPVMHSKSEGAGTSIVGILEVVESDFAKNLAQVENEEADSASEYEKVTQENKIAKETKSQDEKYKTQESKSLDKTVAEYSADRESANAELSAVLEYYDKIKERCIAKPETYEERKARREAEIEGLKEAMRVLSEETAFMQRARRGAKRHHRSAFLAAF